MAFSFSSTAGTSGVTNITVSATSNTELYDIVGEYTLANESGSSVQMTLVQNQYIPVAKYIEITPSTLTWPSSGGSQVVTVQSNDNWSWEMEGWMSTSVTGGTSGNTIIPIYVGVNTGSTRNSEIKASCLSDSSVTASTIVSQTGNYVEPYITLSDDLYLVGPSSASTSVTITSNVDWATMTDSRWITISTLSGSGNGNVSFTIDENTAEFNREGTITVFNAEQDVYSQLVIRQETAVKPYIGLSPVSFVVDASGSTNTISVSANCDYDIEADVNWITLNASSGSGNGSVSFTTGPNSGSTDVGNITFSNSAISSYITVERQGAAKYLSATTGSMVLGLDASSGSVAIHSNVMWYANVDFGDSDSERSWVTLSPSSGIGDGTLTVSVSSASTQRSCNILIYNNEYGLSYVVKVVQRDQNAIYYTSTDSNIVVPGGEWEANIVSNTYVDGQGVIRFDGPITETPLGSFFEKNTLSTIELPVGLTTIGRNTFYGCGNLTGITIPNTVSAIGVTVFFYCINLHNVPLPNSLVLIDDYAFSHCGLTSIDIPSSVTALGDSVFFNTGISTIYCRAITAPTLKNNDVFLNVSSTGTFHYPAGSDYSTWISLLPANWEKIGDL